MSKPWDKIPSESVKAYRGFTIYRDMGLSERSIEKAYQQYVGRPGAKAAGFFTAWSTEFRWRERIDAYDEHQIEQGSAARERLLHMARQELVDCVLEMVQRLRDVALGKVKSGMVSFLALKEALGLIGLVVPKELSGPRGKPIEITGLTEEGAAQLRKMILGVVEGTDEGDDDQGA